MNNQATQITVYQFDYSSQVDLVKKIWEIISPDLKNHTHDVVVEEGYGSPYRFGNVMREMIGSEAAEVVRVDGRGYYAIDDISSVDPRGTAKVAIYFPR